MSLQLMAMLMAVSCLSPVMTHTCRGTHIHTWYRCKADQHSVPHQAQQPQQTTQWSLVLNMHMTSIWVMQVLLHAGLTASFACDCLGWHLNRQLKGIWGMRFWGVNHADAVFSSSC